MWKFLALVLLALPALAVEYQPQEVTIQMAPGTSMPVVIRRFGNTVPSVSITVNKGDKVTILQPVSMHGGMHVDTSTLPAFDKGYSELRTKPTTEVAPDSEAGAFRTVCGVKGMSFDDSLVYPGQPGRSHFHTFFGNTLSDANSTADSIRLTGNSTCRGGIANRSSYWVPAMLDMRTNKPVLPDGMLVYYKTGYYTTNQGYGWAGTDGIWHEIIVTDPITGRPMRKFPGFADLPVGLRMIAGNPTKTTPRVEPDTFDFRWACQGPKQTFTSEIPVDCPLGSYVSQEIFFPQCWDGKNLDSLDHKSHMNFGVGVRNEGDPRGWSHAECPPTHPVVLPAISFIVNYTIKEVGQAKNWRLVSDMYTGPAGYSSHGDWRNGWMPEISSAFTEHCIRAMKDCHAHLLGDGREIY